MIWLIRAAKYLGCAPWELEERSAEWQDWALMMKDEEEWVKGEQQQQALNRTRGGG